MPSTVFFDTNYIRRLGLTDLLSGRLPPKLAQQIDMAFSRGDMFALLETVRLETNAWLEIESEKRHRELENAIQTLRNNGYTVEPSNAAPLQKVDVGKILQDKSQSIPILLPTIEDYRQAEFRTSFRRPPLPKKQEDEEMRDRIMWCQLLRYSIQTNNMIVMVSQDILFRNGADSEEGRHSRIKVVESEVDLDQLLGSFPDHVEKVIGRLLQFSEVARAQGILLVRESIKGIEGLRNVVNSDGTLTQRFKLVSNLQPIVPHEVDAIITIAGELPLRLTIEAPMPIRLDLKVPQNKIRSILLEPYVDYDIAVAELRNLIGR